MSLSPLPLSRRAFLRASALSGAALLLGSAPAATAGHLEIQARSVWGADLPPTGTLETEAAQDVRFLLVHHSASANDYAPDEVAGLLRSFYTQHTGPKGWSDIAYNFLIDRFGGVWEGRTGSLAGPVKGDATGGSQGFALLCCLIGDHRTQAPSAEATRSLTALLAQLAATYGIDPAPGATTEFVSRGSNRWPTGTAVTAATISAHRDMSQTACPGDVGYRLVRDELPAMVAAAMSSAQALPVPVAPPPTTPPPAPTVPAPQPPESVPAPAEVTAPTTTPGAVTPTSAPTPPTPAPTTAPSPRPATVAQDEAPDAIPRPAWLSPLAATAVGAAAAAVTVQAVRASQE